MNQEKGDRLERAIAAIEKAIVQHNPALKGCNHVIESKKHVRVGGVRHEIDVFVEYDFRSAKTVFLLECKNRNRSAGKDDVYILLKKVDALAAQNGYLVSRDFTKSAKAAAEGANGRIILLSASDYLAENIDFPQSPVLMRMPLEPRFQILLHHDHGVKKSFNLDSSKMPGDLWENLQKRCRELLGAHVIELDAKGVLGRKAQKFRVTEPIPSIRISSGTVSAATFLVDYTYLKEPVPTKVSARFDVPGRGKYIEIQFTDPTRGPLTIAIGSSDIGPGKSPILKPDAQVP